MHQKVTFKRIAMNEGCKYPNLYKKILDMWIEVLQEASNNFELFQKSKQDFAYICIAEAGGEIDGIKINDFTYLNTPYYCRIRDEIYIKERHVPKIENKRYKKLIDKWWVRKYSATILFLAFGNKYSIKEDKLALYLVLRSMFPFISFDSFCEMYEMAIKSYNKFSKNKKFLQGI